MEEGIVARESRLPFRGLPAAALRGRGPLQMLRGIATMATGSLAARRLIGEVRPAAILGTGGYVCVPLFIAARLLGIPTMIYLPDVVPGLAVRFLSRIATLTAVNVEDALPYLYGAKPRKRQVVVTGYPVRAELFAQDRAACRRAFGLDDRLPVVLVYGGSRGARSLNQAIKALLPDLLERCQIIHVCGREGDAVWLEQAAAGLRPEQRGRYRLYPYLEAGAAEAGGYTPAMTSALGAADLAICRSGASTLAELPAAGVPAVLVPYPYVHQDENADYLVRHGAAVKVADGTMLGAGQPQAGPLAQAILRLLADTPARQQMAAQSRALARPHAANDLAAVFRSLATRSAGR
ncbi:UDP-N-acetylglucosamine--N-acetylmuramyl-(pentapeptide) pyrophosphoryl-undecaprenol N-acetylglucosamine transferase [Oscillochloris trichoides DG-6]|uniref:UDP-N-acetylglucosamine--N-acetylmuramyl-(Pentapeptide) pyrophosphoryl-undecaprenol N-acetylglucosamine transferase n=1 Tax=Oscillochloris trichoides DG-6 TaxID=765420 RepID=E1IHI0_9CHLR|nr:UDP-N-acetylglucosamine--N-acetylmuramyl-(pentapeptide) pyrophosphoryl-undecaprenol N-acetylglucosamine transferase [Oscillochloris trichoides DG-6]